MFALAALAQPSRGHAHKDHLQLPPAVLGHHQGIVFSAVCHNHLPADPQSPPPLVGVLWRLVGQQVGLLLLLLLLAPLLAPALRLPSLCSIAACPCCDHVRSIGSSPCQSVELMIFEHRCVGWVVSEGNKAHLLTKAGQLGSCVSIATKKWPIINHYCNHPGVTTLKVRFQPLLLVIKCN